MTNDGRAKVMALLDLIEEESAKIHCPCKLEEAPAGKQRPIKGFGYIQAISEDCDALIREEVIKAKEAAKRNRRPKCSQALWSAVRPAAIFYYGSREGIVSCKKGCIVITSKQY